VTPVARSTSSDRRGRGHEARNGCVVLLWRVVSSHRQGRHDLLWVVAGPTRPGAGRSPAVGLHHPGRLSGGWLSLGRPRGAVYLPSNYLYALNPDGTVRWHSVDEFASGGAPTIAGDGTIYMHSYRPTIRAFDPDGSLRWTYEVASCCRQDVPTTPAVGSDGTIYFGETVLEGTDLVGRELALNPDGSLRWEFSTTGLSPSSAAIGADGTIYFGSGNGGSVPPSVYALNPDGSLKWKFDDQGFIRTPPAIGKGERLYAGSAFGFFAIGP
jgi:outer membrane protein assembly factor BamB